MGWGDLPTSSADIPQIDGDPSTLRSCAEELGDLALDLTVLWQACDGLGDIGDELTWQGESQQAYMETVDRNPKGSDVDNLQAAFREAGAAIETLATKMADAQSTIEWCRNRIDDLGIYVPDDGLGGSDTSGLPPETIAELQSIAADAQAARDDWYAARDETAEAFVALRGNAVYTDPPVGFWDEQWWGFNQFQVQPTVDFFVGAWDETRDMAVGLWDLGVWWYTSPGYTVYEKALNDPDVMNAVIQMAIAHAQNPGPIWEEGTFWNEMGQAAIQWDLLMENPAKWAGHLLPGIVLTVATFGAGAAVAGSTTAVSVSLRFTAWMTRFGGRVTRVSSSITRLADNVAAIPAGLRGFDNTVGLLNNNRWGIAIRGFIEEATAMVMVPVANAALTAFSTIGTVTRNVAGELVHLTDNVLGGLSGHNRNVELVGADGVFGRTTAIDPADLVLTSSIVHTTAPNMPTGSNLPTLQPGATTHAALASVATPTPTPSPTPSIVNTGAPTHAVPTTVDTVPGGSHRLDPGAGSGMDKPLDVPHNGSNPNTPGTTTDSKVLGGAANVDDPSDLPGTGKSDTGDTTPVADGGRDDKEMGEPLDAAPTDLVDVRTTPAGDGTPANQPAAAEHQADVERELETAAAVGMNWAPVPTPGGQPAAAPHPAGTRLPGWTARSGDATPDPDGDGHGHGHGHGHGENVPDPEPDTAHAWEHDADDAPPPPAGGGTDKPPTDNPPPTPSDPDPDPDGDDADGIDRFDDDWGDDGLPADYDHFVAADGAVDHTVDLSSDQTQLEWSDDYDRWQEDWSDFEGYDNEVLRAWGGAPDRPVDWDQGLRELGDDGSSSDDGTSGDGDSANDSEATSAGEDSREGDDGTDPGSDATGGTDPERRQAEPFWHDDLDGLDELLGEDPDAWERHSDAYSSGGNSPGGDPARAAYDPGPNDGLAEAWDELFASQPDDAPDTRPRPLADGDALAGAEPVPDPDDVDSGGGMEPGDDDAMGLDDAEALDGDVDPGPDTIPEGWEDEGPDPDLTDQDASGEGSDPAGYPDRLTPRTEEWDSDPFAGVDRFTADYANGDADPALQGGAERYVSGLEPGDLGSHDDDYRFLKENYEDREDWPWDFDSWEQKAVPTPEDAAAPQDPNLTPLDSPDDAVGTTDPGHEDPQGIQEDEEHRPSAHTDADGPDALDDSTDNQPGQQTGPLSILDDQPRPTWVDEEFPWLGAVNPSGDVHNCTNSAAAVDRRLAGDSSAVAPPNPGQIYGNQYLRWRTHRPFLWEIDDPDAAHEAIERAMQQRLNDPESGTPRGIVTALPPAGTNLDAHIFNVTVDSHRQVRYIDGQTGREANFERPWWDPDAGPYSGYQFMDTTDVTYDAAGNATDGPGPTMGGDAPAGPSTPSGGGEGPNDHIGDYSGGAEPSTDAGPPEVDGRVPVGDLVVDGKPNPADLPAVGAAISNLFEGRTFGRLGCQVANIGVFQTRGMTSFWGDIVHEGRRVGQFERALCLRDGQLHAVDVIRNILDPDLRGQGTGTELDRHLEGWYRESGVVSIQHGARDENGAYAAARAGFNWQREHHARTIFQHLRTELHGPDVTGPERAAAEAILHRAQHLPFGHENYPTPYEITEIGRTEGARDHLGWRALLRQRFDGIKPLTGDGFDGTSADPTPDPPGPPGPPFLPAQPPGLIPGSLTHRLAFDQFNDALRPEPSWENGRDAAGWSPHPGEVEEEGPYVDADAYEQALGGADAPELGSEVDVTPDDAVHRGADDTDAGATVWWNGADDAFHLVPVHGTDGPPDLLGRSDGTVGDGPDIDWDTHRDADVDGDVGDAVDVSGPIYTSPREPGGMSPAERLLHDRVPLGYQVRSRGEDYSSTSRQYLVTYESGHGLYKPIAGERRLDDDGGPLRASISGPYADRAVTFSRVFEDLKALDIEGVTSQVLVPTTTYHDGPDGRGSLMEWVPDTTRGLHSSMYRDLVRFFFGSFDYAMGQLDRNVDNWATSADGGIVAWDPDLVLPEDTSEPLRSQFIWTAMASNRDTPAEVGRLWNAYHPDQFGQTLWDGRTPDSAIDLAIQRLLELQRNGMVTGDAWHGEIYQR